MVVVIGTAYSRVPILPYLRLDVLFAEDLAGAFQIVSPAQQAEVVERWLPAQRERDAVLDGQKAPLAAAAPVAVRSRRVIAHGTCPAKSITRVVFLRGSDRVHQ